MKKDDFKKLSAKERRRIIESNINYLDYEIDKHLSILQADKYKGYRYSRNFVDSNNFMRDPKISKKEKMSRVSYIFDTDKMLKKSGSGLDKEITQPFIDLVLKLKKEHNKKGLNIYGDPIKKKK